MPDKLIIHFDNVVTGFDEPVLFLRGKEVDVPIPVEPYESDTTGFTYEVPRADIHSAVVFRFGDKQEEHVEDDKMLRRIEEAALEQHQEFWCRSWNAFVYIDAPTPVDDQPAEDVVDRAFVDGLYISDVGGRYGLGASKTHGEGVLFGLFHPHAANVYVCGDFNEWQYPEHDDPMPEQFCKMSLHRGYFGAPNIWLLHVTEAKADQTYKFYIEYNSITENFVIPARLMVDPYARFLGADYDRNDAVIVDPSGYDWHDDDYQTTDMEDLIIYELHVHGFTHDHPSVDADIQGTYAGLVDRIEAGYFDQLGVTCLYLMPISEVPTPQGIDALGYNSSLFTAIERDFGTPDDLRHLVDTAHQHDLAVIVDQVFNHSANSWNPLWKFILDDPEEATQDAEGGLYFSGQSPWGNRVSTERTETQNMLIDACKMFVVEYHFDGFRFDATHTNYMDHGFLHRLADELKALKPDVILIVENLPNQTDLNREGYDGFAQWCDPFHDTIKALLRESSFENTDPTPRKIGDIFYFSKNLFAAHTNNVINYCESHDEHSVAHEVSFVEALNTPAGKDRKARLGLFATMVALGQPMIYMGQEFGIERSRNLVYFDFPENLDEQGFYQWAYRLINLRKRYPGLKLHGFNPIEDGQFNWILGSWLGNRNGYGKRVVGWRSTPTDQATDMLVILLNFENHSVEADIHFGKAGTWVRLASIDIVNDIPPIGDNSTENDTALHLADSIAYNFVLPDSSAFIYKWQSG